jgi:hypothetical protein
MYFKRITFEEHITYGVIELEVHWKVLSVSKNDLESLVFLFLDFQGWNPNFK